MILLRISRAGLGRAHSPGLPLDTDDEADLHQQLLHLISTVLLALRRLHMPQVRAPAPFVRHCQWWACRTRIGRLCTKSEICSAHNIQCDTRVCCIRRDKWHAACAVARGVNVRSRRHLTRSQARRAAFASGAMRCPVSSFAQRTTATDGQEKSRSLLLGIFWSSLPRAMSFCFCARWRAP